MKTLATIALTLVLTASLLVGCGCTNQNKDNTSAPTILPTNEEIWNTTESTKNPTVGTATDPTRNTTQETMDSIPGLIIGPPAERLYAVEPVGVATIKPSAL